MKKIFYQFCDRVVKYKYKLGIAGIFLVIGVFGFSDFVLAEAATPDNSGSEFILQIYLMMTIVIKFLSWIWVLLAKIAGMLMTNAAITGEGLGLTEVLYSYHKFIQNLAWLALVAIILKSIISNAVMDYKPEKIVDTIKNAMIASFGIYFIWGLIGIIISISNILFLAISDLGNNLIMNTNSDSVNQIAFAIPSSITRDASKNNANKVINQQATTDNNRNLIDAMCMLSDISKVENDVNNPKKASIESLLPSASDLSGPFIYFGFGIFRFNNINVDTFAKISSVDLKKFCDNTSLVPTEKELLTIIGNNDTMSNIKSKLLSLMIMFLNIFVFSLALVTIIVINFLRMIFIRTLLVFSPLIVLGWVFGKDVESIGKMAEDIGAGSVSSLMGLIFQPVVSIFGLCIGLFFVNSIYASFTNFQTPEQKAQAGGDILKTYESSKGSVITFDQGSSVNIQGSFINDAVGGVGGGISYILMSILTLYILWMIIKVSGNFSKAVGKYTDVIMKKASNVIFDAKVFGGASLGAIIGGDKSLGTSSDSLKKKLPSIFTDNRKASTDKDYDITREGIQGWFGITTPDIKSGSVGGLGLGGDGVKIDKFKDYQDKKGDSRKPIVESLNKTKKKTIEIFKKMKEEITSNSNFKGQKFEMKSALKSQEFVTNWMKDGGLLFLHNAYGFKFEDMGLTKEQITDPKTIDFKKLLESKSGLGAFVNGMLTNDSFVESFGKEDTKFDPSTGDFKDNGTKKLIDGGDNKKSALSVSFDVPNK